jgi:uncharacterized delta-60 repeat protein
MKSTWPLIATLAIAIAACTSNLESTPTTTVTTSQPKFVGLLEVQISGIGEGGTPTSTARFVDPASVKPGLKAKAVSVVPVNGTSALNDVQFVQRSVGFFDDDSTTTRYINNTFELINRTAINFSNFTLYGVEIPGVTVGGTVLANIRTVAGTAITDVNVVRSFKPVHSMRQVGAGVEVNPNNADMQLFTPTEVNNPTDGVQQQAVAQALIPGNSTVLEYGFVARGKLMGRSIAARNTGLDCTTDSCKGLVTLAYKLPRLSPRASNPWSFSLYFVVANDTQTQVSQSLEEQGAGTVGGIPLTSFGSIVVRTLVGSSYGLGLDALDPLCRVRTATGTTADSFLGVIPTPVAGGLDACFGAGGKRTTVFGSSNDTANAVAIQSDGKIVAAGYSQTGSNLNFALARYNTNGNLDTSFDTDGKVTTTTGSSADANAVAIQSDGKIVLAGGIYNGPNLDFMLARYNPNGSLDTSFDTDGKVITTIGSGEDFARAVAIQSDGKIVVAGTSDNGSANDFVLARYNTNGSLDTSFGIGGKVVTSTYPGHNSIATSMAIQADGKIVVAGYDAPTNSSTSDMSVVRYNTNGTYDTGFDIDGIARVGFVGLSSDYARAVKVQADGKIVLAGSSDANGTIDFVLARLNTNGSLDTSFDTDGKVTTAIGSGDDFANAVAIQSDGKIVAAGRSYNGSNEDVALVRYNTNGSLDTSFDTDGKVTTVIGSGDDVATAVAIQSDGKIVVSGRSNPFSTYDFALARYNP